LISIKQHTFFVDSLDDAVTEYSANTAGAIKGAVLPVAAAQVANSVSCSAAFCDERFKLTDSRMLAFSGVKYALLHDGKYIASGVLDCHGHSQSHGTETPTNLHITFHAQSPITE
jgi:hypothetical protein